MGVAEQENVMSRLAPGMTGVAGGVAVASKPHPNGAASSGGKFSVTDPNGKVHPFADQKSADAFKKLAGLT